MYVHVRICMYARIRMHAHMLTFTRRNSQDHPHDVLGATYTNTHTHAHLITHTTTLWINAAIDVLFRVTTTQDWRTALTASLPKRLRHLVGAKGGTEQPSVCVDEVDSEELQDLDDGKVDYK